MHRIDHPTAVAVAPTPSAPGTPGHFTGGDPLDATTATVVTPEWAEAVQEEVSGVVEAAGITLDKTDNAQLLAALQALFGGSGTLAATGSWTFPGGLIVKWTGLMVPALTAAVWTFDTPFPNELFGAFVQQVATGSNAETLYVFDTSVNSVSIDNTPGAHEQYAYALAIGR